jgi:hypothetical protein
MTEDRSATTANDGTPTTPATVPGLETVSRRLEVRASALEWRLWHLVIVAFVADTALTIYGVQAGHVEGNPIMRHALNSLGVAGIVALKSGALAVAVALRPLVDRAYGPLVPAAISLPWFAAALVNVFVVFG